MKPASFLTLGVVAISVNFVVPFAASCHSGAGGDTSGSASSGASTGTVLPAGGYCSLPGSIRFVNGSQDIVPGGVGAANLKFLKLPDGFCAHYFGNVGNARQIRFAPGGELFVASPTKGTTGGCGTCGPFCPVCGKAAIFVLPDDNNDGLADAPVTFLDSLPATQGLMFAPGFFYYQDATRVMKIPYTKGDRKPSGAAQAVVDITYYSSNTHWPKTFDMADDGTIYIGNGGDQTETCDPTHPFHGGVLKIDGSAGGAQVAKGFRNPINIRCSHGHNLCFALELAKDYTTTDGGREKMVPIREGDDWGFPCCATKDLAYPGSPPGTNCGSMTPENVGFLIGDTPFALAFVPSTWPAPYQNHALVGTHGAAGTWTGARVVSVALDAATGLPLPGTNTSGINSGSMADFATGWDDGSLAHGRPAAFDFAADGRLFIASDADGTIFWIAPIGTGA